MSFLFFLSLFPSSPKNLWQHQLINNIFLKQAAFLHLVRKLAGLIVPAAQSLLIRSVTPALTPLLLLPLPVLLKEVNASETTELVAARTRQSFLILIVRGTCLLAV